MPKLLYLATEDWAFCLHFLPMLRVARKMGFQVEVAAAPGREVARILAEGATFTAFKNRRKSLSPLEIGSSVRQLAQIIKRSEADIVHCVNIRMCVVGGLAARIAGFKGKVVLAPTGLGHLWLDHGPIVMAARSFTRLMLARVLRSTSTHYLFENSDDPLEFGMRAGDPNVTIVDGAGVDALRFAIQAEPDAPPIRIAVVSRMLRPKGIAEAVDATLLARRQGAPVELHLYGGPDLGNRRSYTTSELQTFARQDGIVWHGPVADAAEAYRSNHIAMLLSYREGLPKTLVEAAALGRPIIASDVPGCRAVIENEVQGFLVPPHDRDRIAEAILRLTHDEALRRRMGVAARQRFETKFTEGHVQDTISALYARLLSRH